MGADWRDTTTVYGPVFTGVSEPVAELAGTSSDAAAWLYKTLGRGRRARGLRCGRRARARRPALALAFVGWNPVLAVHAAGGGHNDALVGGLARSLSRSPSVAGMTSRAPCGWPRCSSSGCRSSSSRSRRLPRAPGPVLSAGAASSRPLSLLGALSTWLYGIRLAQGRKASRRECGPGDELRAPVPTRVARRAARCRPRPGVAGLAVGLALLPREAAHGDARLGLAACLVLVTTPYLAVWYLAWAVPLAAPEEERASRLAALALTAYLLPQTIPLSSARDGGRGCRPRRRPP